MSLIEKLQIFIEKYKIFNGMHYRSLILIEKFPIFMKIMKNTENINFSSRILSCAVIFIEKLWFSWKLLKIPKNTKFSNETPYRLASLLEKLQFSWKNIENKRKLLKWQIFRQNCIPFSHIHWKIPVFHRKILKWPNFHEKQWKLQFHGKLLKT